MNSAWEHFFAATAVLASAGPIKNRLAEAYREHLDGLDRDDLPKEIRDEFSSLSTAMCRVRPMRVRIVNMLGVIARTQWQQRPKLRAVNSNDD
jgi:hypothetical protein